MGARGRARQMEFDGAGLGKLGDRFGGSLLKGHPKRGRPLESKLPIHVVLRATRGGMRLPKSYATVNGIVNQTAKKYGVTVYKFANVGNHLHLLIKLPKVQRWAGFIRELTGRIAQFMRESVGVPSDESFWRFRPYTRIIRGWKQAFRTILEYIHLNHLEAEGFISRKETKTLKDLRAIWADG